VDEAGFEAMQRAVVDGDRDAARALASSAVAAGADLLAVVERGFAAGIRRVGELWEEGEYFLPELIQGAEAMKAAMAVLQPALGALQADGRPRGRVVIGTVPGDLHDIGKGLVATLLAAHGFEVHDLGADVPIATFVRTARDVDADVVAASALLTTTMLGQRELVSALERAALPRRPRVLVGGAPAGEAWAAEIGAAYAENALRAVAVCESLVAR
jgi:corrinoid protein of di/trimethylamine methyltransferase